MPGRLKHGRRFVSCTEHVMGRTRRNGRMKNPRFVCTSVALLVGVLAPARAFAQSDSSRQDVQELRKQLNELLLQTSKLQARLSELESTKTAVAATTQAAPSAKPEGTIQSTEPLAQAAPSRQVGEATVTYTIFSEDNVAAARFDNVPLDPKYKGFFH